MARVTFTSKPSYHSFANTRRKMEELKKQQELADKRLKDEKLPKIEFIPSIFQKKFSVVPIFSKKVIYDIDLDSEETDFHQKYFFPEWPEWAISFVYVMPVFYSTSGYYLPNKYKENQFYYCWEKGDYVESTRSYNFYLHIHYSGNNNIPMFLELNLYLYNDNIYQELL